MTFMCQLCGNCCSTMGEIISIQNEIEPFKYRVRFTVTGEERVITIDPDKRELFRSLVSRTGSSLACPFLRKTDDRKNICTMHTSRPDLCRQYACFRILVMDRDRRIIGKVMDNTRYFTATDHDLYVLWQRECAGLDIGDDSRWDEAVKQILSWAGYIIIM